MSIFVLLPVMYTFYCLSFFYEALTAQVLHSPTHSYTGGSDYLTGYHLIGALTNHTPIGTRMAQQLKQFGIEYHSQLHSYKQTAGLEI